MAVFANLGREYLLASASKFKEKNLGAKEDHRGRRKRCTQLPLLRPAVRGPFVFWTRSVRKRKVKPFRPFELNRRLTIFLTAALGFASFGWGQTPALQSDPQAQTSQTAGSASNGNQTPQ